MYNPSYLIRSRHAIYYFRYPLARYDNQRVSISLDTRCPKEALLLAKTLEYHALMILNAQNTQEMDYAEVRDLLRKHFAEVLERMKRRIDKDGPLSEKTVDGLKELQYYAVAAIEDNRDELYEQLFCNADDMPDSMTLNRMLKPVLAHSDLTAQRDSTAYETLRTNYKFALSGYITALLEYNNNHRTFDFSNTASLAAPGCPAYRKELTLAHITPTYLKEAEGLIDDHNYRAKKSCIEYLQEVYGPQALITDIDYTDARQIKDMLQHTPSNRNKLPQTRDKSLTDQIEILKEQGLKPLSGASVNKYLGQMSSLFGWAKQNKYISENPFEGMRVKVNKKDTRRDPFSKGEISTMLKALSVMDKNNAKEKTRYWGAVIAIYTGARLNEIASLLPSDIKQDTVSGLWYFHITDEEESKKVKTDAGRRIVPVHPKLIELGFIDYVAHAREVIAKSPKQGAYDTRLLYDLTYATDSGWGRKIGRWFNNTFLTGLDLKTEKKTLHSLRHSFITSLSIAGVEGATIKSMVGHEQGTVTERHYTHYGVEHLPVFQNAIEKLDY